MDGLFYFGAFRFCQKVTPSFFKIPKHIQQMTVRDFVSQYGETEFMKNLPAASASAEDLGGAVPSTCLKSGTTSRPGNRETPTTRSFDILS